MADQTPDASSTAAGGRPSFETDEVDANLAIEQGLGVGARELAAQRDPGGVVTADEDDLDESLAVQGVDDDDGPGT